MLSGAPRGFCQIYRLLTCALGFKFEILGGQTFGWREKAEESPRPNALAEYNLMDIGCNCFGVATAAKVPVKRYNLLVPAIFPVTEPSPDKPLSVGVEKNIHRLSEYLGRNEHRIPKASRRLARTIHADLKRKKLGYVKVGVEAFKVLVHACDSRFARLYAQELLVRYPKKSVSFGALHRDLTSKGNSSKSNDAGGDGQHETSLVGVLLANNDVRAQKMGMELLLSILKIQDSAEYISSLDNFVPMLCRLAEEESRSVSAVALQCLLEHLRLCSRISYVAKNMDLMTLAVLEIIEHEGDAAIATYEALKEAEGEVGEHGGQAVKLALGRLSIGSRIGASPPCQAAVLIFKEIGWASHESVNNRNVVEYWIEFLDRQPARWSGGAALRVGLGILRDSCTIEHQKYVLACALVHHLGSRAAMKDHAAVLDALVPVALSQAALLGPENTPAVLLLAVRVLGGMLDASTKTPPIANVSEVTFSKTAREAVQALAIQTGSRAQAASVIEAALLHPTPSGVLGTLFLCEAISAVYLDIPINTAMGDLNLTETMVTAVQSLEALSGESATQAGTSVSASVTISVTQDALSILRHTLEATTPGSHTSDRAARALMSFMWSVIGARHATPSMLVALQALFRSFTETDITANHGDVLAVMFAASLNRELARALRHWATQPSDSAFYWDKVGIPRSQVVSVAIITCGIWECLSKSSVGAKMASDAFDAFKPVVFQPEGASSTLEINDLGLAVVKDDIDGSFPFQDSTQSTDKSITGYTVDHPDPNAILRTLGMSGKLGPSLAGRIEFLHGPGNYSPRKTSRNIVSAIQRVVSVQKTDVVAGVDQDEAPEFDVHTTPLRRARAALVADPGLLYDSGMDALNAISAQL